MTAMRAIGDSWDFGEAKSLSPAGETVHRRAGWSGARGGNPTRAKRIAPYHVAPNLPE